MKRVWGHVLAGFAIAACGGAGLASCAHDDSTIFVRSVLAPQLVSAGQSCVFTSDPTQAYITAGKLDLELIGYYSAEYLLGNQLVAQGNPNTPTNETSFVTIQGAVVRITDTEGNQLNTYTRLAAATIPPAVGSTPSYAAIGLIVVDPATAAAFGPTASGEAVRFVTYVRFFGKTLGGESLESDEFEFPVDVCQGCLISFADTNAIADCPPLDTPAFSSTTTETLPVPCIRGQDDPISCSQCLDFPACHCGSNCAGAVDAGSSSTVDAGADSGADVLVGTEAGD